MDGGVPDVIARLRAAGCVFAEEEAALLIEAAAGSTAKLRRLVDRRAAGAPLEPLLGWAEFAGRRITVVDGVFVPRRRTELLARLALTELAAPAARPATEDHAWTAPVFVELCAGAAPVATVLASTRPHVEVYAADIDRTAVEVAGRNLAPFGGEVWCGDLLDALPERLRGRIDVLAANAPYVPTSDIELMPHEAREHEPAVALDGGPDGLDVATRLIAAASAWLAPRGALLIETSPRQATELAGRMATAGFTTRIVRDDDVDGTVVVGQRSDP